MADPDKKRTPRDLLRVVFRRRSLFLLASSLFAIAAMLAAHGVPVKYTGTARLERRTDVAAEESLAKGGESFEASKLALEPELAGRKAVEKVVDDLGLTNGLPRGPDGRLTEAGEMEKQEIVLTLTKGIKVTWDARSPTLDLVSVSVTDPDPVQAEMVPNTLVSNYIDRTSDQMVERQTASRDFLDRRVKDCTGRLGELNKDKIEFETNNAGYMPESPGALQQQIDRTRSDLGVQRRQQNAAKQTIARLEAATRPTTGPTSLPVQVVKGPNPELRQLEEQLREYHDRLDKALVLDRMTEKHPTVVALRSKIAQLERRITETPAEAVLQTVTPTGITSVELSVQLAAAQLAAAHSEVESAGKEMERLQQSLKELEALMANSAAIRQDYVQIIDRINKQKAELDSWQKRLTEVDMALQAEVAKRRTHLNAVELAQKQFRPSFPSLWMVLGFALVGGLAFGGGLVYVVEFMDRSLATNEEAMAHFDLPIHGVIGEVVTRRQRRMAGIRRWVAAPIVSVVVLAGLGLAGLSVVLWLRVPDQYQQWKADPLAFVFSNIDGLIKGIWRSLLG